jgi:hypothetical protein
MNKQKNLISLNTMKLQGVKSLHKQQRCFLKKDLKGPPLCPYYYTVRYVIRLHMYCIVLRNYNRDIISVFFAAFFPYIHNQKVCKPLAQKVRFRSKLKTFSEISLSRDVPFKAHKLFKMLTVSSDHRY